MMRRPLFRTISFIALAFCLCSCLIHIDPSPRWKVSLKNNGVLKSISSISDPSPGSNEYSHPEFFVNIGDTTVFRFNDEMDGFKLQFCTTGPFVFGQRYEYKKGERFFDVRFDWLYPSDDYYASSGWITFKKSIRDDIPYVVEFEFDMDSQTSPSAKIRNGVFTVYEKSGPRTTGAGLTDKK